MNFTPKQLDLIMWCVEQEALYFNDDQLEVAESIYEIVSTYHKDMRKHYKKS